MNNDLTDYPVCPHCNKEWKPDDLDPCNEEGYLLGIKTCHDGHGGCGERFIVNTYTCYSTRKIE